MGFFTFYMYINPWLCYFIAHHVWFWIVNYRQLKSDLITPNSFLEWIVCSYLILNASIHTIVCLRFLCKTQSRSVGENFKIIAGLLSYLSLQWTVSQITLQCLHFYICRFNSGNSMFLNLLFNKKNAVCILWYSE